MVFPVSSVVYKFASSHAVLSAMEWTIIVIFFPQSSYSPSLPSPRPPRNTACVGVSLADRKSGLTDGVLFSALRTAWDNAPEKNYKLKLKRFPAFAGVVRRM